MVTGPSLMKSTFLSGIRMQTGEEVVHSKISEQDEEEGDNTEDMVDDW